MNISDDNYNNLPNFESLLAQRLQSKTNTTVPNGNFDPCELMRKRHDGEESMPQVQKWPVEDIKALEDFCRQRGLLGVNCGRMSPKIALQMLKAKFGDYTDVPIENRTPYGYQKIGDSTKEKELLCG